MGKVIMILSILLLASCSDTHVVKLSNGQKVEAALGKNAVVYMKDTVCVSYSPNFGEYTIVGGLRPQDATEVIDTSGSVLIFYKAIVLE